MTRRWRDNKSLVQLVRLFLIDEVCLCVCVCVCVCVCEA